MKFKTLLFSVSALVIIGLAIYGYFKAIPGSQDQESLPRIAITPRSFNFGEVAYGSVLDYTFRVQNVGEDTLEIKKVATSCACTTAKIEKRRIEPGEKVDLEVSYDTGAMSGPHGRGEQERIIYVRSNDPHQPQDEVTVTAIVK